MFCFFYIQIMAVDYVPRLLAQAPALFEFERRNTLGKASAEALHIQIGNDDMGDSPKARLHSLAPETERNNFSSITV